MYYDVPSDWSNLISYKFILQSGVINIVYVICEKRTPDLYLDSMTLFQLDSACLG